MDFSPSEIESTIPARLRRVAETWPARPAVRTAGSEITFAVLDAESDRVAVNLLRRRGPVSETIATLIPTGIDLAIAFFGILKAGKTIVPLFPDDDRRRLDILWENSLCPPILTDGPNRSLAASVAHSEDGLLDIRESPSGGASPAPASITPDTPGELLYTSGTTSTPKGVILTHRMLLHSAYFYHDQHRYSERDRFSVLSASSSSTVPASSIYTALCGTTLVHAPAAGDDAIRSLEWLGQERITVFSIVALDLFRQSMQAYGSALDLPALREVNFSGVDVFRKDLEEIRKFLSPSADYVIRLSSTDINQICEVRLSPDSEIPWEKIPVGRAVPGKEILLLTKDRQPTPIGEIGEIAVRSRYLPTGYWRQPELTAERFLPDPEGGDRRILLTGDMGRLLPDGNLEFQGRTDNVTRIQGQNVQLEEVEGQLSRIPGIREAAALVTPWGDGRKRLAAYIVPEKGAVITVDALRRQIAASLAPHMIPTVYVFLDALPRAASGKIDRKALPPPSTTRPLLSAPYAAPRNDTERRLCALWSDLLHIDPIGIQDNFYDLGGDSLLVLNMVLAVEKAFQLTIPQSYFRKVTIDHLVHSWQPVDASSSVPAESAVSLPARARKKAPPFSAKHEESSGRVWRKKRIPALSNRFAMLGPYVFSFLAMQMPYELGCRLTARICSSSAAQRLFFRVQSRLFQRFRDSLGGCPDAPADALAANLMGNILWPSFASQSYKLQSGTHSLDYLRNSSIRFRRDLAQLIETGSQERFERLFQVSGWEILERAYARGEGVILTAFHTIGNRVTTAVIPRRLGCKPIRTMSYGYAQQQESLRSSSGPEGDDELTGVPLIADLTVQMLQWLREGNLVQVVADTSNDPRSVHSMNLEGAEFHLHSGFPMMALSTGAAVIPLYSTYRLDGSILIKIFPPIAPSDPQAGQDDKIRDMLAQYADFVNRSWHASPEAIGWYKMENFFHRRKASLRRVPPRDVPTRSIGK
jgi:acyl-CoA synthetase (AMP-forming)/AMP-acid ligase II/lauroyl/myristoyl acyltransferase/acyl carrier protein